MLDINKAIANEALFRLDPNDNLGDALEWNERQAREIAQSENILLTPSHWEVVHYLRDYYRDCGMPRSGMRLMRCMEEHFSQQGGKKYLYQLFPYGPVSQACRIAGLPLPPYSRDLSFGSVE